MITVKYGAGNTVAVEASKFPTVGSILADGGLQSMLGFGDNVEARVQGIAQHAGTPTMDGSTIELVQKACSKA